MTRPPDESFVHLHNHSDYSLLHGAMRVPAMVKRAAELRMPAIALTDHGNLFGAVEFYLQCQKHEIRPILGMEAFVVRDHREMRPDKAGPLHSLVLLAANDAGWRNLVQLSSAGYLDGLLQKPRVDKRLLAEHAAGLVALSSGPKGEVATALAQGDRGWAARAIAEYREIFGTDGFFLEIQNHGLESEARIRALAAELANEQGVRLVATNNCHYLHREHAAAHDVLLAIQMGKTVDDPTRWRYEGEDYFLKDAAAMRALFPEYPDAVENTLEIAERCRLELKLGQLLLPAFPLPEGFQRPEDYLAALAREGAQRRYSVIDERVEARLAHELSVIERMGFAGYFLIVSDFVRAAKQRNIPVGPGRGSAAGSLVCYAVEITDIDPLAHDLLFERFLNPERISMPDIDIDFCYERRDEVIDFVIEKYGKDSVCQIITYGTMLARGVIRDVGRALGLTYGEVDRIAKLVPEQLGITLEKALQDVEELRLVREEDPRYNRLIHVALELEGLHRHSSIHAAGILIAPGKLTDHVPLCKSGKDEITTQWDMKMVEAMGLLKMDFLGLRTLTVIDKALQFVNEEREELLSAGDIPLDDPAIYELLSRGETVGVFQLESSGMQEVLKKLKPSSFDDITAVNALYRPGPLGSGMVDDFIDRKHGRKPIEVLHPKLEPILRETYGVILYQEQVMRIAGELAGFSMGEADTLRKAMGKKIASAMEEMKTRFVNGAELGGVDRSTAVHIFDLIAFFAGYGFNKSHSASYAVLSAQTAWLKAHHPAAFVAAALTSEMTNTSRVMILVEEARNLGLTLLPPDVNTCTADFRVVEGSVRFGLGAVKNVGLGAIDAIVEARQRLGRSFRSLYEFCEEVDLGRVNRRVVESLVLAGALDSIPGRREQKLAALDLALVRAQRRARDREKGQHSLFGAVVEPGGAEDGVLPDVAPWSVRERLRRERDLTGLYLTGHPLDEHEQIIRWMLPQACRDVSRLGEDQPVLLCGVVSNLKTVTTRRSGQLLAFVGIEDFSGTTEALCFAEPYEANRELLASDAVLVFAGRTSRRDEGDTRLVLEKVLVLDDACAHLVQSVRLSLAPDMPAEQVDAVLQVVAAHPGSRGLYLELKDGEFETRLLARRAAIAPTAEFLEGLARILGPRSVKPVFRGSSSLVGPGEGRGGRRRPRAAWGG